MEATPVTTSAPASESKPNGPQGSAPELPNISLFEKIVRVISIPAAIMVAYYYVRHMSRDGIRDLFTEQGWFKSFEDTRNQKLAEVKNNPINDDLFRQVDSIDKTFKEETNNELKRNGFTNTWRFFRKNSDSKKLNILMTAAAAFSIALGFFAIVAEPRNRSAFLGWFGIGKKAADNNAAPSVTARPAAPVTAQTDGMNGGEDHGKTQAPEKLHAQGSLKKKEYGEIQPAPLKREAESQFQGA